MKNIGTLTVATPTPEQIVLTRVFNAPRILVFDAFTKPDLLRRWFGPRGWSLVVCEVDFRIGGGFRFVLRSPEGNQMGMRGTYCEIDAPYRSVHTESFDDLPRRVGGEYRTHRARRKDSADGNHQLCLAGDS